MSKINLNSQQIEGSGIIETIYNLLWLRDPIFGTIPTIRIPDTVVIQYGQPTAWFFVKRASGNSNVGMLKKKNKENLKFSKIIQSFCKNSPPCGVVATFMQKKNNENDKKIIIHHFNEKTLKEFFSDDNQEMFEGVLQKFLQPKGDTNHIIKAFWGPKLCFFERLENKNKINDFKFDIYERTMLPEAKEYHIKKNPLRGYVLPNLIEKMCYNISQHLKNVTLDGWITKRMVLNFKIDDSDHVWFLYCSALKLDVGSFKSEEFNEPIASLDNNIVYRYPYYVKGSLMSTGKSKNFNRNITCFNCLKQYAQEKGFEIDYKTIIEGYENLNFYKMRVAPGVNPSIVIEEGEIYHSESEDEKEKPKIEEKMENQEIKDRMTKAASKDSIIPPIIKRIHPFLKERDFNILKKTDNFLKNTIIICEECYLKITKNVLLGGNSNFIRRKMTILNQRFYGTGPQRPEVTKNRLLNTMKEIKKKVALAADQNNINEIELNSIKNSNQTERKLGKCDSTVEELNFTRSEDDSIIDGRKSIKNLALKNKLLQFLNLDGEMVDDSNKSARGSEVAFNKELNSFFDRNIKLKKSQFITNINNYKLVAGDRTPISNLNIKDFKEEHSYMDSLKSTNAGSSSMLTPMTLPKLKYITGMVSSNKILKTSKIDSHRNQESFKHYRSGSMPKLYSTNQEWQ